MNTDAFFEVAENFLCLQWALMPGFTLFNYMWKLWFHGKKACSLDSIFVLIVISRFSKLKWFNFTKANTKKKKNHREYFKSSTFLEIKELPALQDLTHLLQEDILLYWLMGGVKVQRKAPNSKGNSWQVNALSQKRIIRRNEVSGKQDA